MKLLHKARAALGRESVDAKQGGDPSPHTDRLERLTHMLSGYKGFDVVQAEPEPEVEADMWTATDASEDGTA